MGLAAHLLGAVRQDVAVTGNSLELCGGLDVFADRRL